MPEKLGKIDDFFHGGAESGALSVRTAHFDPNLAAVVQAWPALPESIKAGIVAIIRTAGGSR